MTFKPEDLPADGTDDHEELVGCDCHAPGGCGFPDSRKPDPLLPNNERKGWSHMKQGTKIALGILAVVLVAALLVGVYFLFGPKTTAGQKNVTITVVASDGAKTEYSVKTDAEFLKGAMDDAEGLTYSGTESDYGMMVDTINGMRADYSQDGAYWAFYINGEYCNYGIETQPVADGDAFSIEYTPAE